MSATETAASQNASWLRVHERDNVIVALNSLDAGTTVDQVTTLDRIPAGHKIAVEPIAKGQHVIKYGYSIGIATRDIKPGNHVHSHNLTSGLDANLEYQWNQDEATHRPVRREPIMFDGYRRPDGRAAIRNEIWIINTVGCVNMTAARIAERSRGLYLGKGVEGIYSFPHPCGC